MTEPTRALRSTANPEINGSKLRELRKLAGLTVTEVAEKIGISISYLAQIERGARRTVAPGMFVKICDAMGVVDRRELLRSVEEVDAGDAA